MGDGGVRNIVGWDLVCPESRPSSLTMECIAPLN
jgi:hypothetical protein